MIFGIDLGSRAAKIVTFSDDNIGRFQRVDTMDFYRDYALRVDGKLTVDLKRLDVRAGDVVVATGYGRHNVGLPELDAAARAYGGDIKFHVIPELNAHVAGAIHQTGLLDFTLLDVGGQDTKVIKVADGIMADFVTNDKCAASSGRYLENMATVLGVAIDELAKHVENPAELSATCAVFAESELIGKVVEGHDLPSLCAGVNWSIWRRLRPLIERMRSRSIVFAGGVALNSALRTIIARQTKSEVIVPAHPGFNGAIGCCVRGRLLD
ncbi:MAG: 2-hydroxyglutaryl-CoA dehydratase [Chloroflexi bacterium]|nr:2-hydroxyglutaryl-CoA dehydratase [Chloroflexota bacterium]